ncbi:hypothetical protein NDU88_002864 [Pleurodeles waltl]|uniref:Uncharacterized protein n=1 Tax=Pleurodeles waltl TaxID=8319 RepID=A0AAV7TN45_PLEWA|nr:hypothetical protein NDU88_002864 [Pleurodeles waltl]
MPPVSSQEFCEEERQAYGGAPHRAWLIQYSSYLFEVFEVPQPCFAEGRRSRVSAAAPPPAQPHRCAAQAGRKPPPGPSRASAPPSARAAPLRPRHRSFGPPASVAPLRAVSGAVLTPAFMWLLVFRGAGVRPALPYRSSAAPAGRTVAEAFRPYGPYLLLLGAPRAWGPLIQLYSPQGESPSAQENSGVPSASDGDRINLGLLGAPSLSGRHLRPSSHAPNQNYIYKHNNPTTHNKKFLRKEYK